MEKPELIQGKIYHISYGGNTQIVGRFQEEDCIELVFYDLLHYWNGFESFRQNKQRCVKSGIDAIRYASQAEKTALIRFELEHNCI